LRKIREEVFMRVATAFCFVTKHWSVTNSEIRKIETEFKKNNFEVIDQIRLGEDGIVLKIKNFLSEDFTYLEKVLALDINFSVKVPEIKKLLIADMDSTIINSECIDELAEYAGVRSEVSLITEKAMAGELNFSEALKQRVKLLRGLTVQQLTDCCSRKIYINNGAKILVNTMSSLGSTSALVSGGFSCFC
jgi:secreted Zn-dependent insulinase-like peptidase